MSMSIVDSIIELNSSLIGILPSRRQVEFNGGYVNNWDTISFAEYIKNRSNIIIERDHAGVGQNDVDEYHSYWVDSKVMDIIHIDPWKRFPNLNDGIKETIENIKFLHRLNPNLKLEIGTEEAIRPFSIDEIDNMIIELKTSLSESEFNNIIYICIQSGVRLDLVNQKNIGEFNIDRLMSMIEICEKYGKLSKEHNGDYLNEEEIKLRFNSGLNALNIGPEIVQIETKTYLENMNKEQIDKFYIECLNSKKWVKWVDSTFDITDKEKLILVCGHYNYEKLSEVAKANREKVMINIKNKLKELVSYV